MATWSVLRLLEVGSPGEALYCDGNLTLILSTCGEGKCVILVLLNLDDMKTISLLISMLILAAAANAQSDSWKIYHYKKLLLNTAEENETKNVVKIKIYTWSLPQNPRLAATIRIRRVHLCTLEFE